MNNRFCERCQRSTQDGNLWCQDRDCPAEAGNSIFRYGDYLGDMKIIRQISAWRTAAMYEAERNGQPVWVKIAHADPECEERLKAEAAFLLQLSPYATGKKSGQSSFRPMPRPLLPQLAAIGYTPANITYLALSHYHGDHVANASLFAGSTWIVQKGDRDPILAPRPANPSATGRCRTRNFSRASPTAKRFC